MPETKKTLKQWVNPVTDQVYLLTEQQSEWQAGLDALLAMWEEWIECCEAQARPLAALVTALEALDAMREAVLLTAEQYGEGG